jgi:hypothetical protein
VCVCVCVKSTTFHFRFAVRNCGNKKTPALIPYSEFENWGVLRVTEKQYKRIIHNYWCFLLSCNEWFYGSWQLRGGIILTLFLLLYETDGNVMPRILGNTRDCKNVCHSGVQSLQGFWIFQMCVNCATSLPPTRYVTSLLVGPRTERYICYEVKLVLYVDGMFNTRWFKYDRDRLWLVYTQSVPVIFEPPCT